MLQANRLHISPGKNIVIAGDSSGKRVQCSAQALPVFNNIVKLAQNGNHWAGLIIRGIKGLTSGRLHLDNIYIDQKNGIAYGKGAFHIVLPGVTATLEELSNGQYILQFIKADHNYQQLQEQSLKPGLWKVSGDSDVSPVHQKEGKIQNKEFRPVIISDMAKADALEVAAITQKDLSKANGTIKQMVEFNGFDLHYTPGNRGLVGLKKAKDSLFTDKDKNVVKSAMLLANSMYQARNINGVLWYSDWGGSAVLTRALQILDKEKSISLENHSIFLNHPTSSTKEAISLAEKLKITPLGAGKKSGLTPIELRGHIMHTDVTAIGAVKATGFGLSATGAALALTGALPVVAGAVSIAGAMYFIGGSIKAAHKNLQGKKYK